MSANLPTLAFCDLCNEAYWMARRTANAHAYCPDCLASDFLRCCECRGYYLPYLGEISRERNGLLYCKHCVSPPAD